MVADDCSATNQQINSIIPNSNYNPNFLYYALQFFRPRLEKSASKVTVPILNKSNFENFQISVPGKAQQDVIAHDLIILDRKLEICERKKFLLNELFRIILHQLMTAQIRVDDIEFEGLDI